MLRLRSYAKRPDFLRAVAKDGHASSQFEGERAVQRAVYIRTDLDESVDASSLNLFTRALLHVRIFLSNKVNSLLEFWRRTGIACHALLTFNLGQTEDPAFSQGLALEHSRKMRVHMVGRDLGQILEKASQWTPTHPTSTMFKNCRWVLATSQQHLLADYLSANNRLVECMKMARAITDETIISVEEHLLLPYKTQSLGDRQYANRLEAHWIELIRKYCRRASVDSKVDFIAKFEAALPDPGTTLLRRKFLEYLSGAYPDEYSGEGSQRLAHLICKTPFEIWYSDRSLQVAAGDFIMFYDKDVLVSHRRAPPYRIPLRSVSQIVAIATTETSHEN